MYKCIYDLLKERKEIYISFKYAELIDTQKVTINNLDFINDEIIMFRTEDNTVIGYPLASVLKITLIEK